MIGLFIYTRLKVAKFLIGNMTTRRNLSSFEVRLQLTNAVVRTLLVLDEGPN